MSASVEPVVERFVRDTLGCSCPQEVFRTISITRVPSASSHPSLTELQIGSRLLIRIAGMPDEALEPDWLEGLAQDGCAARDRRGFNRFRLVLTTDDVNAAALAADGLRTRFEQATARDERAHLHVLEPSQLPDELAAMVAK